MAKNYPPTVLPDGLYQVTTRWFCAAFVVEGGFVVRAAPILRKNILRWASPGQAKRV